MYLNGQWDRDSLRHLKYDVYTYRERTISKLNKSHKDESQRITSYLILELQKISTISYDFSIVLFVTDRMAVGT